LKREKYNVFSVVLRLIRFIYNEKRSQLFWMVLTAIFMAVLPFKEIFLPKVAIGTLEKYGKDAAWPLVKVMAIYFLCAGIVTFFSSYLTQRISADNMRMRMRYLILTSKVLQTMDYKNVEDATFWEKNDKALNAGNSNDNGVEGIIDKFTKIPARFIVIIVMSVMVIGLHPAIFALAIIHWLTLMFVSAKTHDFEYSKKEEIAGASRRKEYFKKTSQDFSFGKDIRIFNFRKRLLDNLKYEINAYVKLFGMVENRKYVLGLLGILTLLLTNVCMYYILIKKAVAGMPISSFTMYTALMVSFSEVLNLFGDNLMLVRNEGEYVDAMFKLLDDKLLTEGDKELPLDGPIEIVFDHVTFRYPHTDKDIFKDFSFTIHKGEKLAIVGVNGAGKSTLVKLMCGLYAPDEGHIYINGVDINDLKKENLYALYSTVFQDFNILAFTIRENVACSRENVDDARVMEALEKVGLGDKVKSFEKGLDQMMLKVIDENGTDFSGGERQKLAIARALYKDAPVVIMDEPTAALDALAEAEIYESFSGLVEGKTAIYVSHRLASTRFCDHIALFDGTGVKEYGTHEELMEKKGTYYDMFVVQGKYYQEEGATA
jgi:ATP-binding cassette subfamily B protein/ATP-binding cassette subfamily C protein